MEKESGKKSQHMRDEKTTFEWPLLLGFVFIILFYIVSIIVFAKKPESYNIDNYRYLISALMQIVGTIFAFILSGTLIVLQTLKNDTPNSLDLFPQRIILLFSISCFINLVYDTFVLIMLKENISVSDYAVFSGAVFSNFLSIASAYLSAKFILQLLSPNYQAKYFIEQAKKADNNERRKRIIFATEEMLSLSVKKGHAGAARSYQKTLDEVLEVYGSEKTELNRDFKMDPENPIRMIPNSVERLTLLMLDNGMANLTSFFGDTLRRISGKTFEGKPIVTVEIGTSVRCITAAFIEEERFADLVNFYANLVLCIGEEDNIDTILWAVGAALESISLDEINPQLASFFDYLLSFLNKVTEKTQVNVDAPLRRIIRVFKENQKLIEALTANGYNMEESLSNLRANLSKQK